MIRQVLVQFGFRILETELSPKGVDLVGFASQECPARFDFMHVHIMLQFLGRVFFGFESDRIHEDVSPDAVSQKFLHSLEILSDGHADPFTLGIHEVDDDDLVFDQIVVEANLLAFVRSELEVGK